MTERETVFARLDQLREDGVKNTYPSCYVIARDLGIPLHRVADLRELWLEVLYEELVS